MGKISTSNVKQTQIVSNEILTNNIKLQEEIPTQNNNISATTENNTNTRIFGVTNPVTMNTEITENRKEEEETKDINTNDIKACAKEETEKKGEAKLKPLPQINKGSNPYLSYYDGKNKK